MRYCKLLVLVFFSFSISSYAMLPDSSIYSKRIKEQVKIMGDFMLKKDYKSFAQYTYPKVFELMGGEENMIKLMEDGAKGMAENGSYFMTLTVGEPSKVIENDNELQCTIPQVIEMKVSNGTLLVKSTLIAISIDKGQNWKFLDTAEKNILEMKKVLPNLSEKLYLPPSQEPIFHKD